MFFISAHQNEIHIGGDPKVPLFARATFQLSS